LSHYCWQRFSEVAAERSRHVALLHEDECLSFADLKSQSIAVAEALDLNVGEIVVINACNSVAFVTALLGTWARGAIPCFLHPESPATHFADVLATTKPRIVLRDTLQAPCTNAHVVTLPVPVGPHRGSETRFDPDGPANCELPASILFTSGSTGLPKGVTQSGGSLLSGARRVYASLGLRPDDRVVCPIPFTFDYGWGQLLSCLLLGLTLVLPAPANAFGLCEAIARHRPTVFAAVPSLAADLLSGLAPIRETNTRSVRLITSTGSRMPPSIAVDLLECFPKAALSLNYGLTETYRSTTLDPELFRRHAQSSGTPIDGVDIRILRPDGSEAKPGEHGEIVHRGAGIFSGYWGNEEATRAIRRPDPFDDEPRSPEGVAVFTGDIGFIDDHGLLHIVGRNDGQMKSMGVRVSRDEIEHLLMDSGLIREAAVIGRSHDQIGDMVVAIVSFVAGQESDDSLKALKRYANRSMSRYMRPREYIVTDTLPRNSNDKVDYPALRKAYG
jgi:acyl-CoA synthetase (AMP-forming)/AMP-acid ligase II